MVFSVGDFRYVGSSVSAKRSEYELCASFSAAASDATDRDAGGCDTTRGESGGGVRCAGGTEFAVLDGLSERGDRGAAGAGLTERGDTAEPPAAAAGERRGDNELPEVCAGASVTETAGVAVAAAKGAEEDLVGGSAPFRSVPMPMPVRCGEVRVGGIQSAALASEAA